MNRWSVWLAVAVVVAVNAFVLVGVAIDRSGGVVQRIELTERELPVWGSSEDNTGIAVRLAWTSASHQQEWLNGAQLAELGFDSRVPPEDPAAARHYRKLTPREAFLVFEYEGPAWQKWIAGTELVGKRDFSRLMPVDAGRDPAALRKKYPDQSHHLIVPALIRARLRYEGSKPREVLGWIDGLLAGTIHVPQPYADTLAGLEGKPYKLTLCYGKNYAPWVCGCRP